MALISTCFESVAVVKRPTVGQDAAKGTTSDPFVTKASNLPCSYQESSATVLDVYGQRNTVLRSMLYFAQDPGVEINDIVTVTSPRTGESFPVLVEGEAQAAARGKFYSVNVTRIRQPS